MKIPIVTTEPITLRNTAEAASACATRYCRANMITIGMVGIAVRQHRLADNGIPISGPSQSTQDQSGLQDVLQEYEEEDVSSWL